MAIAIVMAMSTTIQVSRKTLQILRELMRRTRARSYDEMIRKLLSEKYEIPSSMFGSNPKLKPFSEEDEAQFHEL